MTYTGSTQQLTLIFNAMNKLKKERNIKDTEVCDAIENWAEATSFPMEPIPVRTYARYRTQGVGNYKKGEMLYKFFSTAPEPFQIISQLFPNADTKTEEHAFVSMMMNSLFKASTAENEYSDLSFISHTYELYRRSWQVRDGKHVVRSILRIDIDDGIYKLSEFQKFLVPGKPEPVEQNDFGYVMNYGTDIYALTNAKECMKFYDFHEFFPQIATGKPVDIMKGNLIAVSGYGENPSYRIYARRAVSKKVIPGHYRVDEFKDDDSMTDILNYVMKFT